jgi:hypothetical protein
MEDRSQKSEEDASKWILKACKGRTFTEITEQEIRLAPGRSGVRFPGYLRLTVLSTKYSVLNTHYQLIKFFGMLGKV